MTMEKRGISVAIAMGCIVGLMVPQARAGATALTTKRVAAALLRPVQVTSAPGDFERLFIVEQHGRIKVLIGGSVQGTLFLDLTGVVVNPGTFYSERGLLGMTFHPDFQNNGYFYVNYTATGTGATHVVRYTVSANPNVADAGSAHEIITFSQPFSNHNGGCLAFGPDGYLYIGTGDGGSGDDPQNNAQTLTTLLGKMLRIDVDNDDFPGDPNTNYAIPGDNPFVGIAGLDEIWAYGIRNPWRYSFDRATGDLYMADVGQDAWEEVDFQFPSSLGGENYGWRCMEGNSCTTNGGCTCFAATLTDPIHVYSHSLGCSVTGGHVYRGCAIPDLNGTYFFGDWCTARMWSFRYDGATLTDFTERTTELAPSGGLSISQISSFGEDAYGELYVVDYGSTSSATGEVYKIIPAAGTPDVDSDSVTDLCDNCPGDANPNQADADGDGAGDACDGCPHSCGDINGSGGPVDLNDFLEFAGCFNTDPSLSEACACSDLNGNDIVDLNDFLLFTGFFAASLTDSPPNCE